MLARYASTRKFQCNPPPAYMHRDSKIPTYQRMWSFMESAKSSPSFMRRDQEGVFMNNNAEGIETVKAGNGLYAFLMESTTIDYVVERHCDTTQIGGLLGQLERS